MKYLANSLILLILVACTFLSAAAQTGPEKPSAPAASAYDAALAAKLGADERGMKMYVMCFLKTGPLKVDDQARRDELMKGHFAMINRLAAERKLIVAGPFSEGGDLRGLYLFDVGTIEEAQKLTETDPSIKEGYFKVEFVKWYGSAALMQVNDIHKKIAKVGI